jgi:excisionase family DNA binding protein
MEGIHMTENTVPIWEKMNLTLNEAAELSNIGINKLREITDEPDCDFVLFVGRKRLIKRKGLEQYLENIYSI